MAIQISIVGATGYVGAELVRLLQNHPAAKITHLISSGHAEEPFSSIYANGLPMNLPLLESLDIPSIAQDTDVFFTSLPHGASQEAIAQLYKTGKYVIDMSGDFRYDDPELYQQWYGVEHQEKELLRQSVYGMPELHRENIAKSRLVGNNSFS